MATVAPSDRSFSASATIAAEAPARHARPPARTWSRRIVGDLLAAAHAAASCVGTWIAIVLGEEVGLVAATETPVLARVALVAGGLSLLLSLARRSTSRDIPVHPPSAATVAAIAAGLAATVTYRHSIGPGPGLAVATIFTLAAVASAWTIDRLLSHPAVRPSLRKNVAIYGANEDALRLSVEIARDDAVHLVGIFEERRATREGRTLAVRIDGRLEALLELASRGLVDEIILALPASATSRVRAIATRLQQYPVRVLALPQIASVVTDLDGAVLPQSKIVVGMTELVECRRIPIGDWGTVLKAVTDRSISALMLAVLSPLFLVIAAAIKLDSRGPVFFLQRRHGLAGEAITVWKFRTMSVMEDGVVVRQATRNDPRVTRVGRLLRKSSLDELPQLINVLQGNMSLVGPRPHAIAHNEQFAVLIPRYSSRNRVRPGITGWAQINGHRGEVSCVQQMSRRVEHDIWYLSNWSFLLDLKILLLTPVFGLVHKNAY